VGDFAEQVKGRENVSGRTEDEFCEQKQGDTKDVSESCVNSNHTDQNMAPHHPSVSSQGTNDATA
jgi:hypothetical protein